MLKAESKIPLKVLLTCKSSAPVTCDIYPAPFSTASRDIASVIVGGGGGAASIAVSSGASIAVSSGASIAVSSGASIAVSSDGGHPAAVGSFLQGSSGHPAPVGSFLQGSSGHPAPVGSFLQGSSGHPAPVGFSSRIFWTSCCSWIFTRIWIRHTFVQFYIPVISRVAFFRVAPPLLILT